MIHSFFRLVLVGMSVVTAGFLFARTAVAGTQTGPSFVVNSLADTDDGSADFPGQGTGNKDCTLREAINAANAYGNGATITFGVSGTITLGSALPNITRNCTIDGSGQSVTVSGNDSVGIFLLYNQYQTVNFNALTIAHSRTNLGSIYVRYAYANITNCTFNDNYCYSPGGALCLKEFSHTVVANCTFYNNSAVYGGGIFIAGVPNGAPSDVRIYNSTFYNNHASFGTGTYHVAAADIYADSATAEIRNTLLVNTDPYVPGKTQEDNAQGLTYADTSDIFNVDIDTQSFNATSATAALINLDNTLRDNGGPTKTLALLPGSVAIGAGNAVVGNAAPVNNQDQRGRGRIGSSDPACDVGAYEYNSFDAPAAPSVITPAPGTYENGVTITLSSTTPDSSFYYTTDGSTPTPSNPVAHLYSGPFLLAQSGTLKAITTAAGYANSTVASATYTILYPLDYWRSLQALPADGSQDLANPSGDGIANLLKYAFNLAPNPGDLANANYKILAPNGTAGLPSASRDAQGRLVIEFLRRKSANTPGLSYVVESSSDLQTWTSLDLTTASTTSIDGVWERVTAIDPIVAATRFGRVRVLETPGFSSDFNYYPIGATLYGSATFINQQSPSGAIQLTDEVDGGVGWMILDGPPVASYNRGFRALFDLQLGPIAGGVPADGLSFAVGDLPTSGWSESGPTTGHSIAVGFDTYNNGSSAQDDIGIHVWVNGVHIVSTPVNPYTNGVRVPVEINYDVSSGLSINFNGTPAYTNVPVSGFSCRSTDQFGFAARTGGFKERAIVDNVRIAPR